MIDHTTAEKLLHRYFDGETSLAEETELRAYFRAGGVRADLAALDPMFGYWEEQREIKAPATLKPIARQRRPPVRWLMATAAAVLLLLTANGWLQRPPDITEFQIAEKKEIDWSQYEVTDPEEAYRILRGALKTASTEMNRGTRITVRELGEMGRVLK